MKRYFITTVIAVFAFSSMASAAFISPNSPVQDISAATGYSTSSYYKDIKGHKYREAIEFLTDIDVVKGYGKGLFKPNEVMNRVEMLKVLVRGSYFKIGGDPFAQGELESYAGQNCFEDVKSDEWYTKYVCYAKKNGWVVGYKDGFRPADQVTFAEALKMTMKIYGYGQKEGKIWYKNYLDSAEMMDILPPTLTNPNQIIKRGEMADMLARMIQYKVEDTPDLPEVEVPDPPGGTYDPPSPYIP